MDGAENREEKGMERRMRAVKYPKNLGIHILKNPLTSEGLKRREEVMVLSEGWK